jgi:hypothetical protein
MRKEEIYEMFASDSIEEIIKRIETADTGVPNWERDLKPQYEPMEHAIMKDLIKYPPKLDEKGQDEFKRTPLGLQKLSVKRVSQSMFATPVYRTYTYDNNQEQQRMSVELLETMYKVENSIDATNIERAKRLNASCQIATVWWARELEEPYFLGTEQTKWVMGHKTYSPKDGYKIFPHFNEYEELTLIGIGYENTKKQNVMDVYTQDMYVRYVRVEEWEEEEGSRRALEFMPVVYMQTAEPVWGGLEGTAIVEQLEEMESYQGLYIKSNSLPTFAIDMGDTAGKTKSVAPEKSTDRRRLIQLGKGGSVTDVTWTGAGESIEARYKRLRNAFFEQIQMPDISFATLISSNTSAENKELVFADAKQKAIDLGGEWIKFFKQEMAVVKKFAYTIFPSYRAAMEQISVRTELVPYDVKSEMDTAEYVNVAGSSMSLGTRVRLLGAVDDVQQEVEAIQEEGRTMSNQGIF